MSQLFGKWTIKSHIEVLAWFDDSKIEIIKRLHQDRKNKLLDDESRYEQTFNQIFFWDLLDYEDRINRIPKWWILGSGIADLTIWDFADWKYETENVQVVCELKWAKSNLSKKQFWHGWLSPVGQWFAYKTWLKNCKRLIVSNFYEIRLYRDNTTDFEIRNLDELLDPKDNYFNLRKLYLLLHRDNLLTGKTEKLLSHFREEQQKITKKFYQEYKELRIRLIKDIRKNNPNLSVTTSVEKAQKIIDRLIFIFFCEDKGLLPDKKLKEWIVRAWEFDISPREMTKKFFTWVDSGSEKLWIPDWYNGWLFKEDSILNSLRISDDICNDFVWLTNYNFDDDISVNILWHIFEQSISDLEGIKEDLIWRETQDNSKWRRKKDWIFYTPEYIVDYIVQNSVMKYLNEKEDECLSEVSTIDEKTEERRRKKNIENPEQKAYLKYQQILQNIKVLDPACGSGAFLVRVFDVLLEENKRVGSILNSLFDEAETYKNILTNNIYGVDLNEESVEITKLSLWLKSAQKGKKLNNLDANIKCGNSLIDDPAVAGDKAFDWKKEFPWILWYWMKLPMKLWQKKEVGFDIIVWNPPYVRIQGLQEHHTNDTVYFQNNYKSATWSYDIYILFIEKWFKLLKRNWKLWFILPHKFTNSDFGLWIRGLLSENTSVERFISFGHNLVFEEATTYTGLLFLTKNEKKFLEYSEICDCKNNTETMFLKLNSLWNKDFSKINYNDLWRKTRTLTNAESSKILQKISTMPRRMTDVFDKIFQWIATSWDKVYIMNWIEEWSVVKLYSEQLQKEVTIERWLLKPMLKWEDIKKYIYLKNENRVLFPYNIENWGGSPMTEEFIKNNFPKWYEYLKENETFLRWREHWKMDKDWWFLYIYPKSLALYCKQKIMTPEISLWCNMSYDNDWIFYHNTKIYSFIKKIDIQEDYKFRLCILNSSIMWFFLKNTGYVLRWWYFTFKTKYLEPFWLPVLINADQQQPFIERADKMLSLNKELHELTDKFLHRIQDNLKIEKLTNKLKSFYEWEFKDFLDELKKQKISLSLSEQDDREPYLKEYKEKILSLKGEIERTDKEIDEMVYKLYGLTEEEIKVVEGE